MQSRHFLGAAHSLPLHAVTALGAKVAPPGVSPPATVALLPPVTAALLQEEDVFPREEDLKEKEDLSTGRPVSVRRVKERKKCHLNQTHKGGKP